MRPMCAMCRVRPLSPQNTGPSRDVPEPACAQRVRILGVEPLLLLGQLLAEPAGFVRGEAVDYSGQCLTLVYKYLKYD